MMSDEYTEKKVASARDVMLLGLDTAEHRIAETIADISEEEYNWEFSTVHP